MQGQVLCLPQKLSERRWVQFVRCQQNLIFAGLQLIPVRFRLPLSDHRRLQRQRLLSPFRKYHRKLDNVTEHAELLPKFWILFVREVLEQPSAHTGRGLTDIEAFRRVLRAGREPQCV